MGRTRNLVLQIHLDQEPLCKLRTTVSKLVYTFKICPCNNIHILHWLRASSGPPLFTPFILGIADKHSEGRHDAVRYWVPPKKCWQPQHLQFLQLLLNVKFWAIDSNQHAEGALGNDSITLYIYKSTLNTYLDIDYSLRRKQYFFYKFEH